MRAPEVLDARWNGRRRLLVCAAVLALTTPVPAIRAQQRPTILDRRVLDALRGANATAQLFMVRQGRHERLAAGRDTITLRPGDLIVNNAADSAAPSIDSTLATPHYDLPARILVPTVRGAWVGLSIVFESQGLSFSPGDGHFFGVAYLGLQDSVNQASSDSLATPVRVLLSTPEASVVVSPASLSLTHTNLPFTPIRIETRGDVPDTLRIRVRPSFSTGTTLPVVVVRPRLTVTPAPERIAGFGLEETVLSISLPPVVADTRAVAIASRRAQLSTSQLTIAPGAIGTIRVRSKGVGPDTIRVSAAMLGVGIAVVQYGYPWTFLLASTLGGLMGTVVKSVRERRKNRKAATTQLGLDLLAGVVAGIIVGAAYALGINMTGWELPSGLGDAGAFLAAAISAWFGVKLPKTERP